MATLIENCTLLDTYKGFDLYEDANWGDEAPIIIHKEGLIYVKEGLDDCWDVSSACEAIDAYIATWKG